MPLSPTSSNSDSSRLNALTNTDSCALFPMALHPQAGNPPSPPTHFDQMQRQQWESGFQIAATLHFQDGSEPIYDSIPVDPFRLGSYEGRQWRHLNSELWANSRLRNLDIFEKK